MTKEEIIQDLIDRHKYVSYLEIGSQNGYSFDRIRCKLKVSVDPDINAKADYVMTSDDFFSKYVRKFNIIFIDGLHHAEQVELDIVNASSHLHRNDGCIVLHDLNPELEIQQKVPRENKQWTGDCWRAFVGFRKKYHEVESYCHADDWGVGVIFPKGQIFEKGFVDTETSWGEFEVQKSELLNFI